jgi:hypothetical protein
MSDATPPDLLAELCAAAIAYHPRSGPTRLNTLFGMAAEEIERLTAERDEARRMWCEQESRIWDEPATKPPECFATEKGWDCFNGVTDPRPLPQPVNETTHAPRTDAGTPDNNRPKGPE